LKKTTILGTMKSRG